MTADPEEEEGFVPLRLYTQEEVDLLVRSGAAQGIEYAMEHIDLADVRTSNAVADAIVRFVGGTDHVMFSDRYPWHRTKYRREHPEHYDLYRRLMDDPQQHKHVIDVQYDGAWTMRHPLEERLEESLFSCRVVERVYDLGIDAMPDPGRYVVKPGERHIDFEAAP